MASVVADASVLLALGPLDRLGLLRDLFQELIVPPTVSREVSRTLPQLPDWIRVIQPAPVNATRDSLGLHQGELGAIALAPDVQASLLILDDLPARRHAVGLGLAILGTAGVLVMAKRSSLLPSVREPLEVLRRRGFRLRQDVYEHIQNDGGEEFHG
jgi:predicted nucleic acid-binding protein